MGYIDFMQYYKSCNAPTFESLCIADEWDLRNGQCRWLDICMLLYRNNLSLLDTSMLWYKQNVSDTIIPVLDSVFKGFYKDNPAKDSLSPQDDIQEQILCLMIDYNYEQGQSLADMDIGKFMEKSRIFWHSCISIQIQNFVFGHICLENAYGFICK